MPEEIEIVALAGNWRVVKRDDIGLCAEMKGPDGKWRFPDCAFECVHCGDCLGCQRKWMFTEPVPPVGYYRWITLNDGGIGCEKSPTGMHEYDPEEI